MSNHGDSNSNFTNGYLFNDEIKNRNFNVRMFNVSKISHFCEVLSFDDLINKFIPFIYNTIFEYENTAEVLAEYGKNLYSIIITLVNYSNEKKKLFDIKSSIHMLIQCYYGILLKGDDDDCVIDACIEGIEKVIKFSIENNNILLKLTLLSLLDKVNDKIEPNEAYGYTFIIPRLFRLVDNNTKRKFIFSVETLCQYKKNENIRRFMIKSIAYIIDSLNIIEDLDIIKFLYNKCTELINNQNEFIIINSIKTSSKLISKFSTIPNRELLEKILNIIVYSNEGKLNLTWRLKETIIDFCYDNYTVLDEYFIENSLMNYIITNLIESDNEVKATILNRIDTIFKKPSKGVFDKYIGKIISAINTVTINEQNIYVRKALAGVINKVLYHLIELNAKANVKTVIIIMNKLLKDEMDIVKYELVSKMQIFSREHFESLKILITDILKTPYWRLRYQVALNLKEFLSQIPEEEIKVEKSELLLLVKVLFTDKANEIRLTNLDLIKILIKKRMININEDIYPKQIEILEDKRTKYYIRVFTLKSFQELYEYYENNKTIIANAIEKTKDDPINNVREASNKMKNIFRE